MNKNITLLLFLVVFVMNSFSQKSKCASDLVLSKQLENDPGFAQRLINNESLVRNWISQNKKNLQSKNGQLQATIPVVFHVVYKNASQNIADSNLYRQIDILNECYRKQNANFSQTRPIFDSIAADVDIEFCVANTDTNGNWTSGIVRRQAPNGSFFDPLFGFDNVKSFASGGSDPWPSDRYLNIWVCDMSLFGLTVVLGYATFPGSDPLLDGVVIQYNFMGLQANGTSNDKGKTTVHEVGHWLGLRHIWGDGQNSSTPCDSTDYVEDTPNADSASQQTCLLKNTCSNESNYWNLAGVDPPDMIENYMDYSYDDCMTMFTEGQKARMLGFLNTLRPNMLNSTIACNFTGLTGHDPSFYNQFNLFPNPASSDLQIKWRNTTIEKINFSIYSLAGQEIKKGILSSENSTIDISSYDSGIYFLRIENENNSANFKFIKD